MWYFLVCMFPMTLFFSTIGEFGVVLHDIERSAIIATVVLRKRFLMLVHDIRILYKMVLIVRPVYDIINDGRHVA
jgi:hypothetical protein